MENKEKLISLFKYIKELYAQKYKVVTDVKQQEWHCFIDNIPDDEDNVELNYIDRIDSDEDMQGDVACLLKVSKPDFQICPKPPKSIIKWLNVGWERFNNEVDIIESKENNSKKNEEKEKFDDDIKRVQDFKVWNEKREEWVKEQIRINRTRNFFNQLYMNYISLERDSETIELMVGQGIISESSSNSRIFHPVLLKRLKMKFDSKNNIISILDTTVESEIYTMLLQNIDYINHTEIKTLKKQLAENYYHPFDRNETPDYLKGFIHMLYPESRFVVDKSKEELMYDKLLMYSRPVFFIRKRISGVVNAIENIIEQIELDGANSGPLFNLIGDNKIEIEDSIEYMDLSEELALLSGEDKDILLSKEANREQLEIAKRIERYNAVLVQGPPGTGKTHTISNLMGHFLAQGKSVLVTSHTKKALKVVKEKVPSSLQNLCVSVLEDNNIDMERSVDGITEYISSHSSIELYNKAEKLKLVREGLLKDISDIRKKIFAIKFKEFKPIVYNGKGYSPSEAAKYVYDNSEKLSFIPGKVALYKPLPVSLGDLALLYETNSKIDKNEERELGYKLPNPNTLMSPSDFKKLILEFEKNTIKLEELRSKLTDEIEIDLVKKEVRIDKKPLINDLNEPLINKLKAAIDFNASLDDWIIYAILDGKKGGGFRAVWDKLIKKVEETSDYSDKIVEKSIGQQISINSTLNLETAKYVLLELLNHYEKGKKISKVTLMLHKSWAEVLEKIRINEGKISNEKECDIVISHIELIQKRNELYNLWNELITKRGGPKFEDFGEEPERICLRRIDKIKKYINWYNDEYFDIRNMIKEVGINDKVIFREIEFNSEIEEIDHILSIITKDLPIYIEIIERLYIEMREIDKELNKAKKILSDKSLLESSICKNIIIALNEKDIDNYKRYFNVLDEFYTKYYYLNERVRILGILKVHAPDWAYEISNRIGIHGENKVPENIEDAWKWKQFASIIDDITSEPFEQLQKKSISLNKELKRTTAELAENLAWYHLLKLTEKDIDKKQALQGWKLTVKKIGKGTGKRAPKLKKEAQKLMAKCQTAVPAWIMTINKALESLDPKSNKFDIVIIDEASQSDISALAIMYLAKKIIVVGDDEQVSPSVIGMDIEKTEALATMYIKDIIPNSHLYDMTSSLYDIAKTTFPTLMLKEHFRCVPEIIGYSNGLSYDYKIKPLRDDSHSKLKPATVPHRVDGIRMGSKKVNECEAKNIVALMLACMEQLEYNNMTFGAISLLGDKQAKKINDIALQRIDPSTYEERQILCGNASHFQGDERDVIFLSLVDSNEGEGPIRLVGEGAGKSKKQRYNVAASRAKNQLWVVHSLDVTRDLKSGDMRRDLIEYVTNPNELLHRIENVNAHAESPFERLVGRDLVSKGYHIVPQWKVGSYRIDMVAIYGNDKVAIECDGELFHSGEEKVRQDMERQTVLERLGWRFIRIRGSEYYKNPKLTMSRVVKELTDLEIYPEDISNDDVVITSNANELLERVKIRASQIIDEWDREEDEEYGF